MTAVNHQPQAYQTDEQMLVHAQDMKLREESASHDVLSDNTGIYLETPRQVPDAVVAKVKKREAKTYTIPMVNRLSGTGRQGRSRLIDHLEPQSTRELVLNANEVKHGVPTETFGEDYADQSLYNLYGMARPQLSTWFREKFGLMKRQALVEGYDSGLTDPVDATDPGPGKGLTARIHPNFIFGGDGNSPVAYDATAADYATAIIAAASAAKKLDRDGLIHLTTIAASEKQLETITTNKGEGYILLCPGYQCDNLLKTDGGLSDIFKDGDVRGADNRAIAGVIGKIGQFFVCRDDRFPIMTISGGAITFQYKGCGVADARNLARSSSRYDLALVLGKGALFEFEREALHFSTDKQEFEREQAVGAFCNTGFTRADYDYVSAPTDTSIRNQSSLLVAFDQLA